MPDMQIKLAGIWVALMLTYLLGDVLRIYAGDFQAGTIAGKPISQVMFLGLAVVMVIPIVMILVTLFTGSPINRWANIIVAVFFFLFNIVGLPTYPGMYDKFLIAVSLVFNVMTVWLAWQWNT